LPFTNAGVATDGVTVATAPASALPVAKAVRCNSQGKQIAEANNAALRARYVLQWLLPTGAVNPMDMKVSNVSTGAFK
jgi:hypothetical protein